jgi:putative DNA primase/helicase
MAVMPQQSQRQSTDLTRESNTLVCAKDIVMRPKEWLWKGHLLRGAQELFTGIPGIGKSQAHCDLIARVTRGDTWPDGTPGNPPAKVIMITAEDCLDQEVVPRLVAANAALDNVHLLRRVRRDDGTERMFLLGEDVDWLEREIRNLGDVGLVTIDPITAFMGRLDSYKATDVRAQLAPLHDLAERLDVASSTITHPPKRSGTRGIDQFIGSQAFIAACCVGHVAVEEVIDGEKTGRVLFTNPKNNANAKMPTLAYSIAQVVLGPDLTGGDEIVGSHVIWDAGEVDVTADEALAAVAGRRSLGGREPSARNDAVEFLRQELAEGPMTVKEIQRLAVEVGLLRSTTPIGDSKPFREARQVLGVESKKTGMHDGWSWSLPEWPESALESPKAPSEKRGAFGRSGSRLTSGQQAAVDRAFQRAEDNRKRAAAHNRPGEIADGELDAIPVDSAEPTGDADQSRPGTGTSQ